MSSERISATLFAAKHTSVIDHRRTDKLEAHRRPLQIYIVMLRQTVHHAAHRDRARRTARQPAPTLEMVEQHRKHFECRNVDAVFIDHAQSVSITIGRNSNVVSATLDRGD